MCTFHGTYGLVALRWRSPLPTTCSGCQVIIHCYVIIAFTVVVISLTRFFVNPDILLQITCLNVVICLLYTISASLLGCISNITYLSMHYAELSDNWLVRQCHCVICIIRLSKDTYNITMYKNVKNHWHNWWYKSMIQSDSVHMVWQHGILFLWYEHVVIQIISKIMCYHLLSMNSRGLCLAKIPDKSSKTQQKCPHQKKQLSVLIYEHQNESGC